MGTGLDEVRLYVEGARVRICSALVAPQLEDRAELAMGQAEAS